MEWTEAPTATDVKHAMDKLVAAEANLRIAKEELEVMQARAQKAKPRTPYVTVIGVTDEDEELFIAKRREVIDRQTDVDMARNELKFLDFHKDMHRVASYNNRY